ncbi:unnamed protein product [Blepharisma stoltei]|uniref:SCD domain-containing protein n=1 Tax=Blepharisma stoltei TaxID=1481888 RepID=A0AAU9KIJ7_9CILI|nr:unnamed protein product [Blepharisma stoltei]
MPSAAQKKKRDQVALSFLQNSQNLYEYLKNENVHLRVLVIDWMKHYRSNETEALGSILSFLLQSCGLNKDTITLDDLEKNEMEALVSRVNDLAKENEEYPLVSKNKVLKNFYSNFQFFWVHLVSEANDDLYDGSLLTFLISWMSSLTFSKLRSLRHTSTAGILSMGQALIDVLVREVHDAEKVKTFISTELNKGSDKERVEKLREQEKEADERVKIISEALDSIFKDVVTFRCKDVMMEIRALCIQSMGYWADKYGTRYLNQGILDTMGMMLYDKAPEVRENVLNFLSKACIETNLVKLKDFIAKNKLRLVEMCHDIETKCCVEAIKVCTLLVKAEKLTKEEQDMVSFLLWADAEEVRNAVSDFVGASAFGGQLPKDSTSTGGLGLEQGRNLSAEKALLSIIAFFRDFGEKQMYRVDLLVKAFWNRTCVLRDWEAICELLRRGDPSRPGTSPLEIHDREILINMLISALKHLQHCPDKKQRNSMIALSTTIISHLPYLLNFYRNDPMVTKELVKIPNFLELSSLASKDLKEPFTLLINTLKQLLMQSSDGEIIMKAGQCLGKFAREAHPLQKEARSEMTKLVDDCSQGLKKEFINWVLDGEEGVLETWLWRTESLIAVTDLLDDLGNDRFEDFLTVISHYTNDSQKNVQLTLRCLEIVYYWNLWHLNRITNHPVGIEEYNAKRKEIIEHFGALLAKQDADPELRKYTFKYLCETLMVISGQKAADTPIHYEVSNDLWETLEEYMALVPLEIETSMVSVPPRAFFKRGAKIETSKEDADSHTQMVCLHIARLICMCPTITSSQLPSSFFAHYGHSALRAISTIVKHALNSFKAKETSQGTNNQEGILFNIMLESLIKCLGNGDEDDITKMKELARKFVNALGAGPMRPKQADKFLSFLLDGISFAFSDKANFPILDGLSIFVSKNYLSPSQIRELYERISKDAEKIEEKIKEHETDVENLMFPVKQFLYTLSKIVGVSRPPPVQSTDRARKMLVRRRDEVLNKDTDKSKRCIKKSSVPNENNDDEIYIPPKIEETEDSLIVSTENSQKHSNGFVAGTDEDGEAVLEIGNNLEKKQKTKRTQPRKKPQEEPARNVPYVAVKKSAKPPSPPQAPSQALKAVKKSAKPPSPTQELPRAVKKSAKPPSPNVAMPKAIKKSANPQTPPDHTKESPKNMDFDGTDNSDTNQYSDSSVNNKAIQDSDHTETDSSGEEQPETTMEESEEMLTINTVFPKKRKSRIVDEDGEIEDKNIAIRSKRPARNW